MDLEYWISLVEHSKDTKKGYEALKELEIISENSNALYIYIDKFIDMIQSEKYVIRVRGFRLFCKQAKWDDGNIINNNIEGALSILNDEKPTAVRQALAALKDVAIYKSDLGEIIKKHALLIDIYKYKDTMHGLLEKDVKELVKVIDDNKCKNEAK